MLLLVKIHLSVELIDDATYNWILEKFRKF